MILPSASHVNRRDAFDGFVNLAVSTVRREHYRAQAIDEEVG
jgi:hypothetical protein